MQVNVKLTFRGSATVEVPDHLSPTEQTILARKVALAQILATVENPDCGEGLEDACDEFIDETDCTEEDFDAAKAVSVGGCWEFTQD